MPQYKALVFSEPVRNALMRRESDERTEKSNWIEGLQEHLSLFQIEGIAATKPLAGIYAVAHNLISRGKPTLASPETEHYLHNILA